MKVALAALLLIPEVALAGGYLLVTDTGVPFRRDAASVIWNPDGGGFGTFDTNEEAIEFTQNALEAWTKLPTVDLQIVNGGHLPVMPGFDGDVDTPDEFTMFFGNLDGLSPVVFDDDGSLFDLLFGVGNGVLGITAIEVITGSEPYRVQEAFQAYNGRWIDDISANGEFPLENFAAVITHEFGHALNLDHSQINGNYFLGDTNDPGFALYGAPPNGSLPILFPILFGGEEDALSLHKDDAAWCANLYPSAAFEALSSISGSAFRPNETSLFQGANIVARNVQDPFLDAVSNVSGYLYFPNFPVPGGDPPPAFKGAYHLPGLTPGASYTVEATQVTRRFAGGSGVGPLRLPAVLPIEEFYNGPNEAWSDPPDATLDFVPVTADGRTGVDFLLNVLQDPNEPNDVPDACTVIAYDDSIAGAIDPPVEKDWICFFGEAGDVIDAEVLASRAGSTLDATLRVVDQDGSTLLAYSDDVFGMDPRTRTCLPSTGRFHLVVESYNRIRVGTYTVYLRKTGTGDPEPNDDESTAMSLPEGCPAFAEGCIAPAGDVDVHAFEAEGGSAHRFRLEAELGVLLPVSLDLLGTDGVTVLASAQAGYGERAEIAYAFATGGTYYLRARGLDGGTGLYRLRLLGAATVVHGNGLAIDAFAGGNAGWTNYAPPGLGGVDHTFDGHYGFYDGISMKDGDGGDYIGSCLRLWTSDTAPWDEIGASLEDVTLPVVLNAVGSPLQIEQTTYRNALRADGSPANWTIVLARVLNTSNGPISVGWYYHGDMDVQPLFSNDEAGFDASRNLIYQHNAGGEGPYVGVALLGAELGAHQIVNFGDPASPDNSGGNGDAARIAFISGQNGGDRSAPGPGDRSVSLAANLGTLLPGGDVEVRFAIASGYSLADLQADVDDAGNRALETLAPRRLPSAPAFLLAQNVPNPFLSTTRIAFEIPAGPALVELRVFDVQGRLVRTLMDGEVPQGPHAVTWDARDDAGKRVTGGVYFYSLKAGTQVQRRKLVVLD